MNKLINTKNIVIALAIMLVLPISANAYYSDFSGVYAYGYDTPTYVERPVYITQPVVVQPVYYSAYPSLSVSCSATVNYSQYSPIATITWTAFPYGGNGYYSYSWSGTDSLTGYNKEAYNTYNYSGYKYAYVTIYSNGQSITQSCSPVNITLPYYTINNPVYRTVYQPVINSAIIYPQNQNRGLDIGCFVDPTNAKVNQPVTWSAEVTGGVGPYTYSWTGSDGLNGTQASVIKYYQSAGWKSAIVAVTSADGRSATKACSNAITITNNAVKAVTKTTANSTATAPAVKSTDTNSNVAPASNSNSGQSQNNGASNSSGVTATPFISLANVPWGWVAVIIILVLFFTVMYLIFNRKKI